jgi:hypothetical protein
VEWQFVLQLVLCAWLGGAAGLVRQRAAAAAAAGGCAMNPCAQLQQAHIVLMKATSTGHCSDFCWVQANIVNSHVLLPMLAKHHLAGGVATVAAVSRKTEVHGKDHWQLPYNRKQQRG